MLKYKTQGTIICSANSSDVLAANLLTINYESEYLNIFNFSKQSVASFTAENQVLNILLPYNATFYIYELRILYKDSNLL